ncbi:MAG: hypothetical protein IT291_03900 [Deltaproteobacteria bacterium]|nr:hypothetical protein [Deltaproteobacteria bacterium]
MISYTNSKRLSRAAKLGVFLIVVLSLSLLSNEQLAFACPDIDGLLDVNCDEHLKIITFGDSITAGTGDSEGFGYPGRLNLIFPATEVKNYGRPGERTPTGKQRAADVFVAEADADFIVILEGVNDYWISGYNASSSKSNLLTMTSLAENTGAIALLAKLTAVRRSFQKTWVSSLNSAISPYTSVDFYALGEGIIGGDLVHPNGDGYEDMADLVAMVLRSTTLEERPADSDMDGIYDFAESRFGANPYNADSDGDTLRDGDEVFKYRSNPMSKDSDGDGLPDSYEVRIGTNPSSALPGAPVLNSIQVLPSS